jgi:hypothetical protein
MNNLYYLIDQLFLRNVVHKDSYKISLCDFFIRKPTRCTHFKNLFWHENLHVSESSSVHHQEFIHCALSNGIWHTGLYTAFEQDQDVKLVHLVGFIIKIFVTTHGHMNVKVYVTLYGGQ